MTGQWYIQVMGEARGPFTAKELRAMAVAGTLCPIDVIRRGSGNWHQAADVKGLFADLTGEPPLNASTNRFEATDEADDPAQEVVTQTSRDSQKKSDACDVEEQTRTVDLPNTETNSQRPNWNSNLGDFSQLAEVLGILGLLSALICYIIAIATKNTALASIGTMSLVSSFLWFIIKGLLSALDHLIRVSEFNADRMAEIVFILKMSTGMQDKKDIDQESQDS